LKNHRMVPSQIILTKFETANFPDGHTRMGICEFAKILAFGWNDKTPVHFVSTTDGSEARATVQRKCKKLVATVSCPTTVPTYNKNMPGVDRHDQLRAKYALS
jgi:hypothetical protein